MNFDADTIGCAGIVERGDPDRFRAAMAAPPKARAVLFPLYAFNVEVSRAPWASQEPMIAEMRLQWWRDALDEIATGKPARRHEVVTPLARILSPEQAAALDAAVTARQWDIYREPFENDAALIAHIDATAGLLMVTAAQSLGAADPDTVRDYARAAGVAAWLRAAPDLEARGRIPLLDGTPEGICGLAQIGQTALRNARRNRAKVSAAARPALLAGWQAGGLLDRAAKDPGCVAAGALVPGPFQSGARLIWQAATGRW